MNKTTVVLILLLLFSFPSSTEMVKAVDKIPIGAYWYLWYGYNYTSYSWIGGNGTSHWNDGPVGIVVDKPLMGYYASLNNETLKQQIEFMKKCGLSFAIVSWWGWGVSNFKDPTSKDQGSISINNATINLFRYLKGSGETFKVAIMVEAFNDGDMDYTQVYNYVYNNFYQPYDQWTFKWQDKPLLCFFNPLVPPANPYYTIRVVGSPPNNVDWVFWKGMKYLESSGGTAEPKNYNGIPVISWDGAVSITPRYDDYYLYTLEGRRGYMVYDRNCTDLYRESWNYLIKNKEYIGLILIYSWNEYHERAAIEPHIDMSGFDPYYLTNQTKDYINKFQEYTTSTTTTTIPTTTSTTTVTQTTTITQTTTVYITVTETSTLTTTETSIKPVTTTITSPKTDNSDLITYGLLATISILIIALIYMLLRRR